jgi:O-antigen/teichoic acid export membrane protein
MRRKFITNLILLLSLNFLIKPFWVFGIDRTVQNVVGPGEYGFYFAIFNFAFILQIILDMGITNFNNRNIAQNNQLLSKHFSGIVLLRLVFAIVYMLAIIGIGYLIGYSTRQMALLLVIGFNQFLLTFILYLRSNISALLLFRTDSLLSVMDRALMIIICGVMLWGPLTNFNFTIELFVYAQTASYLLTALVALIIVIGKTQYLKLNWNYAFFTMIIRKSFPYALLVLLMGMYSRIDAFLIERLLPDGDVQAGIFASAFRLLDVANNMSGVLIASLLLPIFSKMIKQKKDISQMVKLPFTILMLTAISVSAISLFYSYDIVTLLYHQHSGESNLAFENRMHSTSRVLILLMFAYVATSATYVFGTLLTANGSLSTLNKVALAGVIVSFGLNFLLIPRYAAEGSAIAALSAQWLTALIQLYLAFRILKIKMGKAFILRLLTFLIFAFIITKSSIIFISNAWLGIALSVLCLMLLSLFLGLLNVKAFILILKQED